MTDSATTPFSSRCDILGQFWIENKNDLEWEDFFDYNDLGLPLAYAISTNMVKATDIVETFVDETWETFLYLMSVKDEGFESLEDVFIASGKIGLE